MNISHAEISSLRRRGAVIEIEKDPEASPKDTAALKDIERHLNSIVKAIPEPVEPDLSEVTAAIAQLSKSIALEQKTLMVMVEGIKEDLDHLKRREIKSLPISRDSEGKIKALTVVYKS